MVAVGVDSTVALLSNTCLAKAAHVVNCQDEYGFG
jgi:hypothetical protein